MFSAIYKILTNGIKDHFDLNSNAKNAIFLFFIGTVSFLILLPFAQIYWLPHDSGVFAFTADSLRNGEILGKTFFSVHPGYHAFLNAALFDIFGRDLLSLRYPLFAAFVIQPMFVAWMLRSSGMAASLLAAFFMVSFGFIQFLDPSPSWYGVFFASLCLFILAIRKPNVISSLSLGLIIGICIMFRHPTGLLIGLASLCCLFVQRDYNEGSSLPLTQCWLAKALLFVTIVSLFIYMSVSWEWSLFFYLGLWPVVLLVILIARLQVENRLVLKLLLPLAFGVVIAISPMLLYQLLVGDLENWLRTTLLHSTSIAELDFFHQPTYVTIGLTHILQPILRGPTLETLLHAATWLTLLGMPPIVGILAIKLALKNEPGLSIYLIFPLIYGLVSFYYQIPIYLNYSLPFYAIGLIWAANHHFLMRSRLLIYFFLAVSCLHALFFSAGRDYLTERKDYVKSTIPGVNLYITPELNDEYSILLDYIEDFTTESDPILVIPSSPEIYFLSKKKSPLPYCCTFTSIKDVPSFDEAVKYIAMDQPKLLITTPKDKYYGRWEEGFDKEIRSKYAYQHLATIGEQNHIRKTFEIYVLEDNPSGMQESSADTNKINGED